MDETRKLAHIHRGYYETNDGSHGLELVRGRWFLRELSPMHTPIRRVRSASRRVGLHGILGAWSGSIKEALPWAQRYLDGTHNIDGTRVHSKKTKSAKETP